MKSLSRKQCEKETDFMKSEWLQLKFKLIGEDITIENELKR